MVAVIRGQHHITAVILAAVPWEIANQERESELGPKSYELEQRKRIASGKLVFRVAFLAYSRSTAQMASD